MLPPNGWRPRPGKVGQGSLKVLYLRRHSEKTRIPKQKNFFRVQSTRLADPFEPLNSSLAQSAEELERWYGNQKLLFIFAIITKTTQMPRC